jgi:hypothetical protein
VFRGRKSFQAFVLDTDSTIDQVGEQVNLNPTTQCAFVF